MRRSFKLCGISNTLDGTEDDAMYDDEMPEVADDDMEDEFGLTAVKMTMTKNFSHMKLSQTKRLLLEPPLK